MKTENPLKGPQALVYGCTSGLVGWTLFIIMVLIVRGCGG